MTYADSPIQLLFPPCTPFTIRRLVVSVVVNAINTFAYGSIPHVFVEEYKAMPPGTHAYSPPPVVFIGRVLRMLTSGYHRLPCVVLWRSALAVMHVVSVIHRYTKKSSLVMFRTVTLSLVFVRTITYGTKSCYSSHIGSLYYTNVIYKDF